MTEHQIDISIKFLMSQLYHIERLWKEYGKFDIQEILPEIHILFRDMEEECCLIISGNGGSQENVALFRKIYRQNCEILSNRLQSLGDIA